MNDLYGRGLERADIPYLLGHAGLQLPEIDIILHIQKIAVRDAEILYPDMSFAEKWIAIGRAFHVVYKVTRIEVILFVPM